MDFVSSFRAPLLIVPLLMLAGGVAAGPVGSDEAASLVNGEDAVQAVSPSLHVPGLSEAQAVTGSAKVTGSTRADTAASGSALAVEIMKEAEAATGATEPARAARRAAAPSSPRPSANSGGTQQAQEDGSLRELGKAAVHWLKDSIPWLRQDADDDGTQRGTLSERADWNESPLTSGGAGRGARVDSIRGVGTAPLNPDNSVGYDSSPPKVFDAKPNLVSEFIQAVRAVIEHPMTWLVVGLFVIGGVVVKKIDRRPTK